MRAVSVRRVVRLRHRGSERRRYAIGRHCRPRRRGGNRRRRDARSRRTRQPAARLVAQADRRLIARDGGRACPRRKRAGAPCRPPRSPVSSTISADADFAAADNRCSRAPAARRPRARGDRSPTSRIRCGSACPSGAIARRNTRVAPELRRHLLDESGPFAAVDRDAAPAHEQRPEERHAEQRILAGEAKGEAGHEFQAQADRRVPVRRVRIEDHDAALGHRLRQHDLPAGDCEQRAPSHAANPRTSGRSMTDAGREDAGRTRGEGRTAKRESVRCRAAV